MATQGLGGLSDAGRGIICHSTLAVTPERLPLRLLAQRNWVRDDATFGKQPSHKKRAMGYKESIKWLECSSSCGATNDLWVKIRAKPEDTYYKA